VVATSPPADGQKRFAGEHGDDAFRALRQNVRRLKETLSWSVTVPAAITLPQVRRSTYCPAHGEAGRDSNFALERSRSAGP